MPDRLPEGARPPADFDPAAVAKTLLRATRAGTLGTLDRNTGHAFGSLVTVATDVDGSPLILTSRLSTHTANLEADGRASVLLAQTGKGDPLAHPRLTVLGTFAPVARETADDARVRRRFLARHPKSELYAGFGDFSFWRMNVVSAHLNGGFARAADLKASDVLTDLAGTDDLLAVEEDAVGHMNADHADAVRLYATKLLGAPDAAQQADIGAIEKRYRELFSAGKYADALIEARRLEEAVKAQLGTNHARYATALQILGTVHRTRGSYAEAEGFYKQALTIREQ